MKACLNDGGLDLQVPPRSLPKHSVPLMETLGYSVNWIHNIMTIIWNHSSSRIFNYIFQVENQINVQVTRCSDKTVTHQGSFFLSFFFFEHTRAHSVLGFYMYVLLSVHPSVSRPNPD